MEDTLTVRSNLAPLIAAKAEREGEKITIARIAGDTRLSVNTVKRYLRGGEGVFDGHAVAVLCNYLGCKIEDLLQIVNTGQSVDADQNEET